MTSSPSNRLTAEIAVIGAGPAGLAAAVAACDAGAQVLVIDAEPAAGGQFWRHPAPGDAPNRVREAEVAGLHHGLNHYRRLVRQLDGYLRTGRFTQLTRHEVWAVEQHAPDAAKPGEASYFRIHAVDAADGRTAVDVSARALILATGAYDLQIPFPGWDLPGVMTAGGVQSLLKGHAVLAGRRVVVAGTGPFLMSVATGLLRCGATVPVVVEAASPAGWLRHPGAVIGAGSKLLEGARYMSSLMRQGVSYKAGWAVLRAEGARQLEHVVIAPMDEGGTVVHSKAVRIPVDVLAVGWGFVPQLDLALQLACDIDRGDGGIPVIAADADQRTSRPGVFVAGEICGVGGASLSLVEGEIAGLAAASMLRDRPSVADDLTDHVLRRRRVRLARRRESLRSFAAAMARVYPVPGHWLAELPDDTVVCRCEEVTAGAIRAAMADGAVSARSAKLLVRAGMGHCQGRICDYATAAMTALATGATVQLEPVERPIAAPVPLGALRPD